MNPSKGSHVQGGITWIASFPKSGNTWLRFICFYLIHRRQPRDSRDLDRFINSRHKADDDGRFIKTHAAASLLNEYYPNTRGAIYVHRHPLDVICSAANYAVLVGEADVNPGDAEKVAVWRRRWIRDFIANGAAPGWKEAYLTSTWSANVSSWLFDPHQFPVLALGYEDMLEDPHSAVRRIARFLHVPADESFVADAVEATAFHQLKAVEEREFARARETGTGAGRFTKLRMPALQHGHRFFNTGRSGNFKELLDDETIEHARERFGDVARRLGYSFTVS